MKYFKDYDDYCKGFNSKNNEENKISVLLLCIRNYMLSILDFDNMSGETIPVGFFDFVEKANRYNNFFTANKDNLSHIIEEFQNSFWHISKNMHEKIVRENEVMPISKAKEINSTGINWLSRKPGVTIRQKLSNGYKMMAVNRYNSLDTGENRLFKALITDLEERITTKMENLPSNRMKKEELTFHQDLLKVIRDGFMEEIGRWENVAPNNALLSDRHYRNAWKTWLIINELDDITSDDCQNISERLALTFFIKVASILSSSVRLPQDLIEFDFFNFKIKLNQPIRFVIPNEHKSIIVSLKEYNVSWSENERGHFCFLYLNRYGKVAIYETNFINQMEWSEQHDVIMFELEENKRRDGQYIAKKIKVIDIEDIHSIETDESDFIEGELRIKANKVSFKVGKEKDFVEFEDLLAKVKSDSLVPKEKISAEGFDKFCIKYVKSLLSKYYKPFPPPAKRMVEKGEVAVIDIFSLRPYISIDNNPVKKFDNKLLGFKTLTDDEELYYIPVGNSKVLKKSENMNVVSFFSIFNSNTFHDASYLINDIRSELDVNKLIYILPDAFNEFQTIAMHKNMRLNFKSSHAFPKSIGMVFSWQYSKLFENFSFDYNDFVIVVDLLNDKLSFTLLQGKYNKNLEEVFAETRGILWERYPTEIQENKDLIRNVVNILKNKGCLDSEWVVKAIGIDSVISNKEEFSIDFGEQWYHIKQGDIKSKNSITNIDIKLEKFMNKRKSIIGKNKVHIILASKYLVCGLVDKCYKQANAIDGYKKFKKYQAEVDFPLWIDYVPSLSIKQLYGKFELMDDVRIEPQIGKKYYIPIENEFILTKGVNFYEFPLIIGDDVKEAQYEATLKSAVFPLKENVVCQLKMTYEYGAIEPYTLIFEPVDKNKAGFSQVKAEWEKIKHDSYDFDDLPYPKFPKNKSWNEFKNYPKKNTDGTNDLLDWIKKTLNDIGKDEYIEINLYDKNLTWRTSRVGKRHCEIYLDNFGYVKIFEPPQMDLSSVDTIYCILKRDEYDESKFFAKNIKLDHNPYEDFNIEWYIPSLFAFHTVFFNRRKLDNTCPKYFRETVKNSLPKLFEAYKKTTKSDVRNFYFSLLSLMSSEFPVKMCGIATQRILFPISFREMKMLTLAIGNLECIEQKQLFEKICSLNENKPIILIGLLSSALWKNENLIFNLDDSFVFNYFFKSISLLEDRVNNLKNSKNVSPKVLKSITSYLEFILAVFRLREKNIDSSNKKLSMNNCEITKLYYVLDDLTNIILDKKIHLKSYVQIQVTRPQQYKEIPDLIYALLIYVTGKNIKEEIIISGVDED